jgi:hypothetical protein
MEVWVTLWVSESGSTLGCEVFSSRKEAENHKKYWENKNREDSSIYIRHKIIDEPTTWDNERNKFLNGQD